MKKLGVRFDGAKRDYGQSSHRFTIPASPSRLRAWLGNGQPGGLHAINPLTPQLLQLVYGQPHQGTSGNRRTPGLRLQTLTRMDLSDAYQSLTAHKHWHIDVAYINIAGTFVFMATVIDGFSRLVVAWDIAPQMGEKEIEILLQQGRERFPGARPRIISDFVKISEMTHVRTSPFYPQSNGRIERYHRTIKSQCIRPSTPLDMLEGRQKAIHEERDRKLEEARRTRADRRRQEKSSTPRKASRQQPDPDVSSSVFQEDRALLGSNPSV
ncbi:MAG: DDE-type integrase/transposase/recombinase [Planctomycetaceae bacterium]